MLEFTYDSYVKEVTAANACDLSFTLVGAGGGGGGNDRYGGSSGLPGGIVNGVVHLNAGEKIYVAVGQGGRGGWSSTGSGGGAGGYGLDGFSGGTGGNAGPSGWSGGGGGGGAATVLYKETPSGREIIAVAPGGGGGGGGGNRGPGVTGPTQAPYGFTNSGRGGKGQNHTGDGGGGGGGGGGRHPEVISEYRNVGKLPGSSYGGWQWHDPYVWSGKTDAWVYFATSGNYNFSGISDDYAYVDVDDIRVLNASGWRGWKYASAYVTAGWHKITITADNGGGGPYGFHIAIRDHGNTLVWDTSYNITKYVYMSIGGGGQGGAAPGGDTGGTSGSIGYSYSSVPSVTATLPWSYTPSADDTGFAGKNGGSGIAVLSANQTDCSIKVNSQWKPVKEIYIRQNGNWVKCPEAYVYKNNTWTKYFGDNIPSYVSISGQYTSISGEMTPHPPTPAQILTREPATGYILNNRQPGYCAYMILNNPNTIDNNTYVQIYWGGSGLNYVYAGNANMGVISAGGYTYYIQPGPYSCGQNEDGSYFTYAGIYRVKN